MKDVIEAEDMRSNEATTQQTEDNQVCTQTGNKWLNYKTCFNSRFCHGILKVLAKASTLKELGLHGGFTALGSCESSPSTHHIAAILRTPEVKP